MFIYYVYAYLREDGSPYYIGKGKGKRIIQKNKGEVCPPKDKSRVIYVERNLSDIGALAIERQLIRWYGRIDTGTGILRNKTDGGDGNSGLVFSEQSRKAISDSLRGRKQSAETIAKRTATMKSKPRIIKEKPAPKPRGGHNKGKVGIQIAWNKGLKNPATTGDNNPAKREEVRKKISDAAKEMWARRKAQAALGLT